MKLYFLLLSLLVFPAQVLAQNASISSADCPKTLMAGQILIKQCDLLVPSPVALKDHIYVKAWIPEPLHEDTPVVVFLHGRGYTRALGEASSMIEDMGINNYLESQTYLRQPHIILAPQDNFVQNDVRDAGRTDRGQDYWIGADGRDWGEFLASELPEQINSYLNLKSKSWKALGVSMGAHGAMSLAVNYPNVYSSFAAISPVFRAVPEDIDELDRDVLMVPSDGRFRNLGQAVLELSQKGESLPLPRHFIAIHKYDSTAFNLSAAQKVWQNLEHTPLVDDSKIQITEEEEIQPGGGHSMTYWRKKLPEAMNWLNQQ